MNNEAPLFSIVIPTYNHAHLIGRCLDSVVGQTFTNWEAIVVNNFSQDNTIEVVEGYGDARIRLVNFSNGGVIAASRNRGVAEARGEWICFLDSDDWWTPDKLEQCLPLLSQSDLLYHDMRIVRGQTRTWGRRTQLRGRKLRPDSAFEDMLLYGNPIINSSVVMRRSLVYKLGPVSEDKELVAVEDFDYWLRAARVKARLTYIPKVLGYYWMGGGNMSVSIKQFYRLNALAAKYFPALDPEQRRLAELSMLVTKGRVLHLAGSRRRAELYYRRAICRSFNIKIFVLLILLKLGY